MCSSWYICMILYEKGAQVMLKVSENLQKKYRLNGFNNENCPQTYT